MDPTNGSIVPRTYLLKKTVRLGTECGVFKGNLVDEWQSFFEEEDRAAEYWEAKPGRGKVDFFC